MAANPVQLTHRDAAILGLAKNKTIIRTPVLLKLMVITPFGISNEIFGLRNITLTCDALQNLITLTFCC